MSFETNSNHMAMDIHILDSSESNSAKSTKVSGLVGGSVKNRHPKAKDSSSESDSDRRSSYTLEIEDAKIDDINARDPVQTVIPSVDIDQDRRLLTAVVCGNFVYVIS